MVAVDAIGPLNELWIGPVPSEFRRGKTESLEERREALLDSGKGFIDGEMFAELRLPFQP